MQLTAPDPVVSTTTAADADAVAAGAAIDLLREVDVLLEVLGAGPVSELRSGASESVKSSGWPKRRVSPSLGWA